MPDVIERINEQVKALGADWAKYSVVGSFVLYLFGYLSLRFHLSAFGVSTDLAVLDERYLFNGARFLVYAVSAIPSIVLLALPFVVVVWLVHRITPTQHRNRLRNTLGTPSALTISGILLSVSAIQFVMRQCFYFSDLLLAPALPAQPAWLVSILLDDQLMPVYFTVLVAFTLASSCLLWLSKSHHPSATLRTGRALLGLLTAVEFLLLPINFGILVADQSVPRVAAVRSEPLATGEEAWLIWEGKDYVTFLVRHAQAGKRSLLSIPRADIKQIEVVSIDPILRTLFGAGSRQ